jgi:hypothetical protein
MGLPHKVRYLKGLLGKFVTGGRHGLGETLFFLFGSKVDS